MELAADAAAQLQLDAAVLACFLKRQSPLMATQATRQPDQPTQNRTFRRHLNGGGPHQDIGVVASPEDS